MPLIPIIVGGAIVFAFIQADDALEGLNPFGSGDEAFGVGRAAVLGLAGVGVWTLWKRFA